MSRTVTLMVTFIVVAAFTVSGCGTAPKKVKEELTGIKTRVDTLETRVEFVETKQKQVEKMVVDQPTTTVVEVVPAPAWPETNFTTKSDASTTSASYSKPSVKQIQKALKNAGYYSGKIDGVKGKNTNRAIKAFQRDHGLSADGIVGSRTWEVLNKYASGSMGGEEGQTK